jgi:hypothetical protein
MGDRQTNGTDGRHNDFSRALFLNLNFFVVYSMHLRYSHRIFFGWSPNPSQLESIRNLTYKTPHWEQNGMNFGLKSARMIFAHPQSNLFSSKFVFESFGSSGSRISDGLQLR